MLHQLVASCQRAAPYREVVPCPERVAYREEVTRLRVGRVALLHQLVASCQRAAPYREVVPCPERVAYREEVTRQRVAFEASPKKAVNFERKKSSP